MVNVAERTLNEVDVVLWLVEPTTFIGAGEQHIAKQLGKVKTPVVLVINKVDMVKREEILTFIDAYRKIYDFAEIVPVSARSGENTDALIEVIMKYLPYGPQFYDEDYRSTGTTDCSGIDSREGSALSKRRDTTWHCGGD